MISRACGNPDKYDDNHNIIAYTVLLNMRGILPSESRLYDAYIYY